MIRWVYRFSGRERGGLTPPADLVGGKGLGLIEMTALGLPVPPGFILTTDVCTEYYGAGQALPPGLDSELVREVHWLEKETGRNFGSPTDPLLVSVRSGGPASMPGMLDTVLNLGLNESTTAGLARTGFDSGHAWESYCHFIEMFGEVVQALDPAVLSEARDSVGGPSREAAVAMREAFMQESGKSFPEDPWVQLRGAVRAVLDSWQSHRASAYRRIHGIPEEQGTAVTIQVMVFGNAGANSATGISFTRNPSTGEKGPFGEYIPDAQGDDIVSGIRTPLPLTSSGTGLSLEESMPTAYRELCTAFEILERHAGAMQDVEFTIERGKLWLLQTRAGIASTEAALKIAVDMEAEGLLSRERALQRLEPSMLGRVLHARVRTDLPHDVLTCGLPASPGAASGVVALCSDEAEALAVQGKPAVLVLPETHPRDVHGIHAAVAVLTARGGATSHAALIARGAGLPCVVGASDIIVDLEADCFFVGEVMVRRGETVTIDGSSGEVSLGALPMERPSPGESFSTVLGWADDARRLGVRANTASPDDVEVARVLGAEGIGLFRTEYSFLGREALATMQRLLFADSEDSRRKTLADLFPLQCAAYADLFERANGMPVTIRLLDMPLSEFLPKTAAEMSTVAKAVRIRARDARARAERLLEANPVLGHRGCRLSISQPDLYAVQVRAILTAAGAADAIPQILVPMVSSAREFEVIRGSIDETAKALADDGATAFQYTLGAMIELPRAVMQAGKIAESAEFFSFGTNNLTQAVFGIARDNASVFLKRYRTAGLFAGDPFGTLDTDGVGGLLALAVQHGRATRPNLEIGVCGEHGGDPDSIMFFNKIGLDYVSCSPYRVPTARLAAAQAVMEGR